jgi:hypothetical protein
MLMAVSVKKYHNYPKAMVTESEGNNNPSELFYFCLFELSNNRKLSIQTYKTYDDKKSIHKWENFLGMNKKGEYIDLGEYTVCYADEYNFGEDFSDWFDRTFTIGKREEPSDEEYKCVINYYEKHIKPKNN